MRRPRGGVKKAVLSYEILAEAEGLSLALVRLQTGRTHQIRVQFASRGFPLCGDRKYGARSSGALALYSYRISFPHEGKRLSFTLPAGFLPPALQDFACKTGHFAL